MLFKKLVHVMTRSFEFAGFLISPYHNPLLCFLIGFLIGLLLVFFWAYCSA